MRRWSEYVRNPYLAGLAEVQLFPDEVTRREAFRRMRRDLRSRRSIQFASLVVFVLVMMLCKVLDSAASTLFGASWTAEIALSAIIGLAGGLAMTWLWRRDGALFLRQSLLDCGVPVCVDCGYCLRGLTSDRCPECGREIDERLAKLIAESNAMDPARNVEASHSSVRAG